MTQLEQTAADAVVAAQDAGAGEAEAWVERSVSRRIRVYGGAVESLSDAGGRGIGLRAFIGSRTGYAFGTDDSPSGLAELARAAVDLAHVGDEDTGAGLPEMTGATQVAGLTSEAVARWDTDAKIELALAIERAARGHEGVSQVEHAVYTDSERETAIANSRGLAAAYSATSASAWASAFAGAGEDLMTGLGVGFGRGPDALDAEAIGIEAGARALALVGARPPHSRTCAVVFDPFVAAALAGLVGGMLSADAVQRGRSPFAGRLGDVVAGSPLTLTDDGTLPDGPASAPFDGEGTPTRRTGLIGQGRVLAYLHDARSARRDGVPSTASAIRGSYRAAPAVGTRNVVLEPGSASMTELLEQAGEGVYVTGVAGLHSGVNPISGSFSVGAEGVSIESGELAAPVREMTIAGDLLEMLAAVRAVGRDGRWVPLAGSVWAPAVLIERMAISGS